MGGHGKDGTSVLQQAFLEAGAEDDGAGILKMPAQGMKLVSIVLPVYFGPINMKGGSYGYQGSMTVEIGVPGAEGTIELPVENLVLLSSLTKKPKKNPLSTT